jgi:Na+-transporting methylmalonyl-CoA/oxaloacetate decarboxylase gamma subunit
MAEGFVLMVVGMTVVFAFLALMIGAMNLCAMFFIRFAHLFPDAPAATPAKPVRKTDPFWQKTLKALNLPSQPCEFRCLENKPVLPVSNAWKPRYTPHQ